MATTIKGSQIETGLKAGQISAVMAGFKFTGTLAAGASTTLSLPSGVDPTLLIADVTVLDTFSAPTAPTYNWWVPGDVAVTVAKNSTQIKVINESANSVQYTVVLR